jgi:TRAP-type C4-dicarboxylate transport system permease small subunit
MSEAEPVRPAHRGLDLLIEVPAVVVTFLMMLHVTVNAVLRTFADEPLPNTLEYVQYWYLPAVAFLGFIAAQRRGQHVAADLLYTKLPRLAQRIVLAVFLVVSAVLCLGFAWFGLDEALHAYEIRKTAGVSEVPAWPAYFLVPLAFGSLTLQFVLAAIRAVRSADPEPETALAASVDGSVDGRD